VADVVNGLSLTNPSISLTLLQMTSNRSITSLELALDQFRPGWVHAEWRRADNSSGQAYVYLRLAAAERCRIYSIEIRVPTTARLRDVPLARIEAAANARPEIRDWAGEAMGEETVERAKTQAAKRVKLRAPKSRRLDDAHYELVAAAYRGAVANGLPPAKTLADESGVPQGTVNRWIGEARRRGYLPPGEPGRVTT
jgi:hypothetical protein